MLYKTVAYNYAHGLSSFWQMKFTDTSMSVFCEQPPLYFSLLGGSYKLFGDHYLTDRFFTLILFILFGLILRAIVRKLFTRSFPYLLLISFLMLSIPIFCWSYVNQIIEPLLCIWTGLGILVFIQFIQTKKSIYALLFVPLLLCLFLTKGFQSCFIIGLPLSYMFLSRFNKANYLFSILAGLPFLLVLFILLKFYLPAKFWLDCYYSARLVLTMQNIGNTTDNHFEIIGRFFSELILCLCVLVFLFSYLKFRKNYPLKFIFKNFWQNKLAMSLLLTSFLGSFPYAISLVQRGFYLIPSFVCFVLAIVYGFKRYWIYFFLFLAHLGKYKFTKVFIRTAAVLSFAYFCFHLNEYKRNKDLLRDIEKITPYLRTGETVLIEKNRWNDFGLHSYMYMARQVSLSTEKKNCRFMIRNKSSEQLDSTVRIRLRTNEVDLYWIAQ